MKEAKRATRPPIAKDRLRAMQHALLRHIYSDTIEGCEPISKEIAREILTALELFEHGPRRAPRYALRDLRAAAIARAMIQSTGISQEDAVAATFENHKGLDVESLARNYRNLVKHLPEPDSIPASLGSASALYDEMVAAYVRTDHYKARRPGKINTK